jgi:molecular chaperone DnaK
MKRLKKWLKTLKLTKKLIRKKESQVDVRNQADTLIHSTEKNLKEHGTKVSDAEKKAIEDASSAVKKL